jgi:hemerythrin-like metal-binding protein
MKEFIIWNKKWETGIKTIDDQHKHFVGIVNRANVLNKEKKNKIVLGQILTELTEYARIHFSTEEGYFEDTEYPQTEEHEERHQILLGKVLKFGQRFEKEEDVSELVKEFLEFLRDWLDNHLVRVDHKYIPWLTEHGIK